MFFFYHKNGVQHKLPRLVQCAVTLVTDDLTGSGASAADVSGQTTSISDVSNQDTYMATTDLDNPKSLPSSRTVWVESQNNTSSNGIGSAGVAFIADDFSKAFYVVFHHDGVLQTWQAFVEEPLGTETDNHAFGSGGSGSDNVSIGIDGSGNCRVLRNGSEVSLPAAFGSFWTTENIGIAGIHPGNAVNDTPRNTSVYLATQADNYNNDYSGLSGTNTDWCENNL